MKAKRFAPGDRIRLTAKHLRNTGQLLGPAGLSRWIVQECPCSLCKRGDFVATDERVELGPESYCQRHFAVAGIEKA